MARPLAAALAVALLACSAFSAPYALAAGSEGQALQELTEGSPESTQKATTSTSTTSTTSSNNSHTTILLAAAAALVLLCAIGFVIARDARRVAPATDADMAEARSGHDPAVALRKRRAKAKAARQQRKRNR
jgi:hypothetical protein